jgi:hypothetical protein
VTGPEGRLEELDRWFVRSRSALHECGDAWFRTTVQNGLATAWSSLHGFLDAEEARARLRDLERQLSERYG